MFKSNTYHKTRQLPLKTRNTCRLLAANTTLAIT